MMFVLRGVGNSAILADSTNKPLERLADTFLYNNYIQLMQYLFFIPALVLVKADFQKPNAKKNHRLLRHSMKHIIIMLFILILRVEIHVAYIRCLSLCQRQFPRYDLVLIKH